MKHIIILLVSTSLTFTSCSEMINEQAKEDLQNIQTQVANDFEDQYKIAVKGGDKMEIYTSAQLVAEGYKQAKDEANYLKWKAIADKHKAEAGL